MAKRTVLTIGNFDGVHLGHRAIVAEARRRADAAGAEVVALTFEPTPVAVLRPGEHPPGLDRLDARCARLRAAGVDRVEVLEPTPEMLGRTAEDFIHDLVRRHHPVAVVEGPDFRFGKGRAGDHGTLVRLGEEHGFEAVRTRRLHTVLHDRQEVPVSSSLCRWLIGRGRVEDAAACLGRAFELSATVVRGDQRGRTIGVPTANLGAEDLEGFIVPADGVYAGHAVIDGARRERVPAAVSIGVKPTFGERRLTVEAHLLGYDGDLYGRTLTLSFARWLRDQYPFPGVEALKTQLQRDIRRTRDWADATAFSTAPL